MPSLYFSVGADYDEVLRLKDTIRQLEEQLKSLDRNADPRIIADLESQLGEAKQKFADLTSKAAKAAEELKDVGEASTQAAKEMGGLKDVMKQMAALAGISLGIDGMKNFVSQTVRVRGEMQQTEAAFKNMLGSEDRANDLLHELIDTAATTPFDLKSVTDGAKMLMAYGTNAEDVNETLVRLGDIASGLNIPLNDMTYLFGTTMTQGRMYSQDLAQFLGRGIPIAKELAKQFNVTEGEVKELVSQGKIGAEEVKKALWAMSDAGGQFGGLMEAQSKTIAGQISNIEDAIYQMFNSIGQETEGVISKTLSGVGYVVDNWKEVAKVLGLCITAFGSYKTAVMVVNSYHKVQIAWQTAYSAALKKANVDVNMLTAAEYRAAKATGVRNAAMEMAGNTLKKLGKATIANPYFLVAAAITGLVATLYKLATAETAAEKATREHTKAQEEQKESYKQRQQTVNELIATVKDETETVEKRNEAYQELIKLAPAIKDAYSMQDVAAGKADDVIMKSSNETAQAENEEAIQKAYENGLKRLQELAAIREEYKAAHDANIEAGGWGNKKFLNADEEYNILSEQVKLYKQDLAKIAQAKKDAEEEARRQAEADAKQPKYNEAYATAKNAWLDAKAQLEVAKNGTVKEYKDAQDKLKEAKSAFEALGGDTSEKKQEKDNSAEKRAEAQRKADEMLLALQKETEATRTSIMEDGAEKRMKLIETEHDKNIETLQKHAEELAKLNKEAGNKEATESVSIGGKEVKGLTKEQVGGLQGARRQEEARYIKANEDETKAQVEQAQQAQTEYLKQYGDFQEKRQAIAEDYDRRIAESRKQWELNAERDEEGKIVGEDYATKGLEEQKKQELANLELDALKKSDAYAAAFSDMGNATTTQLQNLMTQLEQYKEQMYEAFANNPEQMKAFQDMMTSLADELIARNPFKSVKQGIDEMNAAQRKLDKATAKVKRLKDEMKKTGLSAEQAAKLQDDYTQALAEQSEASTAVVRAQNKVKKAIDKVNDQFGKVQDSLSDIADSVGGVAGSVVNVIGDIFNVVNMSINGMMMVAKQGEEAISTVEKASVILAIIAAAIQLLTKLDGLLQGESAHEQYEKAAEKQRQVNELAKSVRDYEAAVLEAQIAEKNWFASSGMSSLKDSYITSARAMENYYAKATEQQERYVDKTAGRTGFGKTLENNITAPIKAAKAIAEGDLKELGKSYANWYTAGWAGKAMSEDYNGKKVSAVDNLRIETQARQHGTWIRKGKSQKTQDLREWVKENYNADLFDEKGVINSDLAKRVIEEKGEQLQGETKATLEQLVEYKEQWDEYMKQLEEHVSEMYSPLVDNMTEGIMNWLDTGESALDTFQESAGDTFRSIAEDMVKTMVISEVLGDFQDNVKGYYEQYAKGEMTEAQLGQNIANETSALTDRYEAQAGGIQTVLETFSDQLEAVGISMKKTTDEQDATKGAFQTMSEDTASELNGRFTALQISGERCAVASEAMQGSVLNFGASLDSISGRMGDMFNIHTEIAGILSESFLELQGIRENTGAVIEPIRLMQADIRKMQRKFEEM